MQSNLALFPGHFQCTQPGTKHYSIYDMLLHVSMYMCHSIHTQSQKVYLLHAQDSVYVDPHHHLIHNMQSIRITWYEASAIALDGGSHVPGATLRESVVVRPSAICSTRKHDEVSSTSSRRTASAWFIMLRWRRCTLCMTHTTQCTCRNILFNSRDIHRDAERDDS